MEAKSTGPESEITNMSNVTINYPEMWGNSDSEIQAEHTGIGSKPYRVTSKKEILVSRGIEFNGIVSLIGANQTPNKRAGWFKYYMTPKAFERFSKSNHITLNCLLD